MRELLRDEVAFFVRVICKLKYCSNKIDATEYICTLAL